LCSTYSSLLLNVSYSNGKNGALLWSDGFGRVLIKWRAIIVLREEWMGAADALPGV